MDFAVTGAIFLYSKDNKFNLSELMSVKLAANALTHAGLDLAGRTAKRLTNLKPPTAVPLAI